MKTMDYRKDIAKLRKKYSELVTRTLLSPEYKARIALGIISLGMKQRSITKTKNLHQRKEEIIKYHEARKKIVKEFRKIQTLIDADPNTAAYCRELHGTLTPQ